MLFGNIIAMGKFLIHSLIVPLFFARMSTRDPVSEQLTNWSKIHKSPKPYYIETGYGVHVPDATATLSVGPRGPLLLQDVVFLNMMAHFDRERIPERVVHAKGAGGFGYFIVTHDITKYTKAVVFREVGKKTRIAVRFSVVSAERGAADTIRDPRGFAIKFYTDDGIWDLVGNNTPIFFLEDPSLFPMFIHSQKRNPVTNIKDFDMFWDFVTSRPETTSQIMYLFSARGTPDGYRHMDGFGSHTFKVVNDKSEATYVKFHYLTNQGIRNLTQARATELAGTDPDYATRDLYNAIANKDYPSWNFSIQVMTFEQAKTFKWNPFDLTKFWPLEDYPLIPVGQLVLDENPRNYFSDVEQAAYSPAHMIPGIEPSPDKMLQGRLFSYSDTQRYRLGSNHDQLPVNCPYSHRDVTNYQRDGADAIYNQGGAPNYFPNSFGGPQNDPSAALSKFSVSGDVERYDSKASGDYYGQAKMFYDALATEQQNLLAENMAGHLCHAAPFLQVRAAEMFANVDTKFSGYLKANMKCASM